MSKKRSDRCFSYDTIIKDRLIFVEMMARDGQNNEQIAHNLGITVKTLYEWKKKHPEFAEALRYGRYETNLEVENKLLELCRGGKSKSVTVTENSIPIIEEGKVVGHKTSTTTVTENVENAPDFRAISLYLYNNCPERYREITGKDKTDSCDKVEIIDDISGDK